ncbi:uncharacterized protein CTRU02_210951 [Colletotrichum truncatum]|uniref:Uncharacterized protein n=1 Tax=Colletotrichum truncatum TaxID=5467 RepID=A0ACC3YQL4_COLTU
MVSTIPATQIRSDKEPRANSQHISQIDGTADTMDVSVKTEGRCSFEELPFDVHRLIASHLQYRDVLKMSSTNTFFHKNLNPKTLLPRATRSKFLAEADFYRVNRHHWACFGCHKFLPKDSFGDRMRKDKRDKRGQKMSRLGLRRCWTCAINERLYTHLQPVKKQNIMYFLCHKCGRMQPESQRCMEAGSSPQTGELQNNTSSINAAPVKASLEAKSFHDTFLTTVCFDETAETVAATKGFTYQAPFERLPQDILENIVQYTELIDAIHLRQVNRILRRMIKTRWVPLHKRFEFLKQWEPVVNWTEDEHNPRLNERPNLPCYACFVVKSYNKFPGLQHKLFEKYPETFWKRRCEACVDFLHRKSAAEALREFNLRTLCQTCHHLKHTGEACQGCTHRPRIDVFESDPLTPAKSIEEVTCRIGQL